MNYLCNKVAALPCVQRHVNDKLEQRRPIRREAKPVQRSTRDVAVFSLLLIYQINAYSFPMDGLLFKPPAVSKAVKMSPSSMGGRIRAARGKSLPLFSFAQLPFHPPIPPLLQLSDEASHPLQLPPFRGFLNQTGTLARSLHRSCPEYQLIAQFLICVWLGVWA